MISSAPEAQSSVNHPDFALLWTPMNRTSEKPIADGKALRMRLCRGPGCGAMFFVCIGCYRGQRYCREACRETARRIQMRAANARYQRSNAGKISHRSRQRAYRTRLSMKNVTYQGCISVEALLPIRPIEPLTCSVCGHQTVWINPYAAIARVVLRRPRKPQQRNRSATVRIYTFSNDR